jgi:hypothetical protein
VALVLAEHDEEPAGRALDLGRVVRMLLVHDLVEIDAGDTFLHDPLQGPRRRLAGAGVRTGSRKRSNSPSACVFFQVSCVLAGHGLEQPEGNIPRRGRCRT